MALAFSPQPSPWHQVIRSNKYDLQLNGGTRILQVELLMLVLGNLSQGLPFSSLLFFYLMLVLFLRCFLGFFAFFCYTMVQLVRFILSLTSLGTLFLQKLAS